MSRQAVAPTRDFVVARPSVLFVCTARGLPFELAKLQTDKRRARQLGEQALALYRALDRKTEVTELERWLARR